MAVGVRFADRETAVGAPAQEEYPGEATSAEPATGETAERAVIALDTGAAAALRVRGRVATGETAERAVIALDTGAAAALRVRGRVATGARRATVVAA